MAAPPPADLAGLRTKRGLRIPVDLLMARLGGRRGYNRFLAALTVHERPMPGRPKSYARASRTAFYCGREGKALYLYVPWSKAPALSKRVLPRVADDAALTAAHLAIRTVPAEAREAAEPLYDYQAAAVEFVCAGGARPLYVQMGTGLGKTRFGLAAAARIGGPVFIVVPTKAIREQWLDEAGEVFPGLSRAAYDNPPKGGRRLAPTAATHDVVVGIINTVRVKEPGFFAGYSAVVFDEAHELGSPKNLQALWLAQEAPWVIGISATPTERADGLDRVVCHFLGEPIWAERDIPGFDVGDVDFRGRVREVEYAGEPEYCETVVTAAGTVSAIETVGNVVRDPCRLRLVAAEVERLYNLHETEHDPFRTSALGLGPRPEHAASSGYPAGETRRHGVFVFAEHREYLPALREALLERFAPDDVAVPELSPVVLRGGATRDDMGRARGARVVLTTYGYSRRGVSLVDMTAIVLATPRRNGMRQILGRVTRRGSDESILRLVVDIKDVRTALKGQNSDRRKVYKEKGYPIHRVKACAADFAEAARQAVPTSEEVAVWAPAPERQDGD